MHIHGDKKHKQDELWYIHILSIFGSTDNPVILHFVLIDIKKCKMTKTMKPLYKTKQLDQNNKNITVIV